MAEPQLSLFFELIGMKPIQGLAKKSQTYFAMRVGWRPSWCGTLGAGADRDIGTRDDFSDRLLELIDSPLYFTHEKRGIELEKDFDIDAGSRATSAHLVQTIIVVEMLYELAKDTELGGLFDGGVEEVFDGGRGHGPGGVNHKKDTDE